MKKMFAITSFIVVLVSLSINASALEKAENFTLKDYNGKEHSLAGYAENKAIVIIFVATKCPVSNAYNERMAKLYEEFGGRNIAFLGINSNKAEDVAEMKKHAEDNGLKFPILKDVNNVIADKFGATVTPEVYVLDGSMKVLYHGRIDDSQRLDNIKTHDLKNALQAVLKGEQVPVAKTKAFGCTIKKI